ncbi:MAG: TonB-dependent receptor, partial [Alphaproteobacteria bacterium]
IPTGRTNIPNFKIDNYGAELSGPIIKDKLFFMVAGERLRGGRPIPEGPVDNNSGITIPNLTQAQVDRVSTIAQNVYNYDTGGVLRNLGDKDDRVVGRLDANLSDTQRVSVTGTYAKDAINLLNNTFSSITTGSPGLGLASNAYIQGNQLYTGVVQLNSDWSDSFSTEARGFYKHYKRIQDPVLGRGFAQFRVCLNEVSGGSATGCENTGIAAGQGTAPVVSFGPDSSRQTNQLTTETWGGVVQGRLTMNDHDLRLFSEVQRVKIFNSFLQNSSGNYYFDSITDFQNRVASSIAYGNAIPSLVPDDAAAKFSYMSFTFGVMDNWKITPTLNISYGARYDLYGMDDVPALSNAFLGRYSVPRTVRGEQRVIGGNNANISGLGLFQPRFGFDWRPTSRISIRGGGGIFGGGTPDVYVSNSFSNTGVLTNSVSINRAAPNSNTYTGATTNVAAGNAALNGVNGTTIASGVNDLLRNAT